MPKTPAFLKQFQFNRGWLLAALVASMAPILVACGGASSAAPQPDPQQALGSTNPRPFKSLLAEQDTIFVVGAYAPPPVESTVAPLNSYQPDPTQRARGIGAGAIAFTPALSVQGVSSIELRNSREQPRMLGTAQAIAVGKELSGAKSSADLDNRAVLTAEATGGHLIRIPVLASGAVGVRLGVQIDAFPEGAVLRVFGPNDTTEHVFNAAQVQSGSQIADYRAGQVEPKPVFWTPYVDGDKVVLEIDVPRGMDPKAVRIAIPRLSYFFDTPVPAPASLAGPSTTKIGESGACNTDAVCQSAYSLEASGIAKLVITDESGVSGLCTGTMLNDRGNTFTPYLLTANHCLSKQSHASSLQTFFHYRARACNVLSLSSSATSRTGGATLLFTTASTDVTLVRLNASLPPAVAFLGWNPSALAVGRSIAALHHPRGDLLRYSVGSVSGFRNCQAPAVSGSSTCSAATAATGNFYEVGFTLGVTEVGSSGSALLASESPGGPLFVRGQLLGGASSCSNPTGKDQYGRFELSYNAGLSVYLEGGDSATAYPALVRLAGTGSGRVVSAPVGIDCGSACASQFPVGANVVLTATPSSGSTFTGWSGACSGSGPTCALSITSSPSSRDVEANFTGLPVTLATALDNPSLAWTTSGTVPFFGQSQYATAGGSAAQAGKIGALGRTSISTTVQGPGTLLFAWRTSSELGYDFLDFSIGGVSNSKISGILDWAEKVVTIPAGNHVLRWEYSKDSSINSGLDTAWLDNVRFSQGSTTTLTAFINGGFESGSQGWTQLPQNIILNRPAAIPAPPGGGGTQAAWFCGVNNCNESMYQDFQLPNTYGTATLDLYYYVNSAEITSAIVYDSLKIEVLSLTNTGKRLLVKTLSNLDAGATWRRITQDISQFAGEMIRLIFTATTDFSAITSFFVDNVSITGTAPLGALPETGWYWNAAEGGRGWAIERSGDKIFATQFGYNASGQANWYAGLTLARQSDGSYSGVLDGYTGGQTLTGSYRAPTPSTFARIDVFFTSSTNARVTIRSPGTGTLLGPVLETSTISRFPISTPSAFLASTASFENGWWWNAAEPGRGYFIEVQGTKAFVANFGYVSTGASTWFASTMNLQSANSIAPASMDLYANGQSIGSAYRSPAVIATAGNWSFRFTSATTGEMTLPNGRVVALTRFTF